MEGGHVIRTWGWRSCFIRKVVVTVRFQERTPMHSLECNWRRTSVEKIRQEDKIGASATAPICHCRVLCCAVGSWHSNNDSEPQLLLLPCTTAVLSRFFLHSGLPPHNAVWFSTGFENAGHGQRWSRTHLLSQLKQTSFRSISDKISSTAQKGWNLHFCSVSIFFSIEVYITEQLQNKMNS